MVRGFQLHLDYDNTKLAFPYEQTRSNEKGMRIHSHVDEDGISVFGYLIKQNGAVAGDGLLVELIARPLPGFDGKANLAVTGANVAAQSRAPMSVTFDDAATDGELPRVFSLSQNYPNPFNLETRIKYDLPARARVKLDIYNLRGELIRTLRDEEQPAGKYELRWDGRNADDNTVASGVYVYRIRAGDWKMTRRMTLVK